MTDHKRGCAAAAAHLHGHLTCEQTGCGGPRPTTEVELVARARADAVAFAQGRDYVEEGVSADLALAFMRGYMRGLEVFLADTRQLDNCREEIQQAIWEELQGTLEDGPRPGDGPNV